MSHLVQDLIIDSFLLRLILSFEPFLHLTRQWTRVTKTVAPVVTVATPVKLSILTWYMMQFTTTTVAGQDSKIVVSFETIGS